MKPYIFAVISVLAVAGFLSIPANAENPFQVLFNQVFKIIAGHEVRIAELEDRTGTTIASGSGQTVITNLATGNSQNLITINCEIIDAGEQVVRGWCPSPSYQTYLIEDIRVLEDTLVLLNVQDPSGLAPSFIIYDSGFVTLGANTYQGFVIKLNASPVDPQPTNTLIYSVFV